MPAASVSLINSGIPLNHRSMKSPIDLQELYRLSLSPGKVKSLLSFPSETFSVNRSQF